MSVHIFDFILIAVLAICTAVGFFRGFVRSIAGLIEYMIAFFVANRFYISFAGIVQRIPFISNMITDVEMPVIDGENRFFEKLNLIIDHMMSKVLSGEEAIEDVSNAIVNNYIGMFISKIIAFAVLFFASIIVLKLLIALIDKFCELPFLNATNKVLGIVFGVLFGLLITWMLSNLFVNILLPIFVEKWPDKFVLDMGETDVIKFFMKYSPMALIMQVITAISSAKSAIV